MPAQSRPTYEGRVLARPDEELVDQGLSFDVGTLLTRRRMLKAFGLGAATIGLAACGVTSTSAGGTSSTAGSAGSSSAASSASSSAASAAGSAAAGTLTEIPDETNGPYPGDGTNGPDVLEQSGIVRSDIRSSFGTSTTTAEGVPMTLRLNVYDIQGGQQVPYAGAAVYVWHCDRDGNYSMYSSGIENENYLRGVQIADANGVVEFTSIFPACYQGRWPHVHFEVYPDEASISDHDLSVSTSQLAFPADVCTTVYATAGYESSITTFGQFTSIAEDNVFGDTDGVGQIATVTGDVTSGFLVELTVGIDPTTEQSAGMAGGGPGGGAGGGGTPPSGGMGAPPSGNTRPTTG
ncbi:intradiol ring-cleavage dioxygenase [Nakamurella sp.]|uniref:intradiol ring-cleavage dioxygenase n=1 Tax=Nakamurella sp. TaxID=1869182 RepID=UPI003B3A9CE1